MKRRGLLSQATLGIAGLYGLTACGQAPEPTLSGISNSNSLPTIRWRMATSWPKTLGILFGGAERVCRLVYAMTNGNFTITPYAAGEIIDGFGVLDAVSDGTVECGHTASYYYFERNSALAFGTNVPFGLTAQQQDAWLYYGGGLEIQNKIYQNFGIISFPAGNTGVQMGGWFKHKIETVEDLKGLKMRIPGIGSKVMSRMGVDVAILPADRIVSALINDEIDAVEWNNPYDDKIIGLHEAAPYYYYPGWWEPGATYELQVNLEQWDNLPREYQEILMVAASNTNLQMLAEYNARNGKVLQRLMESGTKIQPFSKEIMEAAYQSAIQLYEEYAREDPEFKQIYEQWKNFKENIYQWVQTNELNFSEFMVNSRNL